MNHIVERLRKFDGGYDYWELNKTEGRDLAQEAAAEIERLRAALHAIKIGTVSGHIGYEPVREYIDRILKE